MSDELDEDELLEEITDELLNGNADEALDCLESLGYDVDDLNL